MSAWNLRTILIPVAVVCFGMLPLSARAGTVDDGLSVQSGGIDIEETTPMAYPLIISYTNSSGFQVNGDATQSGDIDRYYGQVEVTSATLAFAGKSMGTYSGTITLGNIIGVTPQDFAVKNPPTPNMFDINLSWFDGGATIPVTVNKTPLVSSFQAKPGSSSGAPEEEVELYVPFTARFNVPKTSVALTYNVGDQGLSDSSFGTFSPDSGEMTTVTDGPNFLHIGEFTFSSDDSNGDMATQNFKAYFFNQGNLQDSLTMDGSVTLTAHVAPLPASFWPACICLCGAAAWRFWQARRQAMRRFVHLRRL